MTSRATSDILHPMLQELERPTLRERVYAALLEAIVAGRLEPGRRILDLDLARQLGVSRTPVREALQRLRDEGLVESLPSSSTRVAPMDPDGVRQAFPVVACLHAFATRTAVPHLAPGHLSAMRASNRSLAAAIAAGDPVAAIAADDDFHGRLLALAANQELTAALRRLAPKVRRLEYNQFASIAGRRSVAQHDDILAACAAGDAGRAAALVESNWLSLGKQLLRALPHPLED
jgi:DNA-binding GntR family transcriptional regulator